MPSELQKAEYCKVMVIVLQGELWLVHSMSGRRDALKHCLSQSLQGQGIVVTVTSDESEDSGQGNGKICS